MSGGRTIMVITGSRADYGLLRPVMATIRDSTELVLQVIATGMHLAPDFGLTYRAIEADGFTLDGRVESLLASDTPVGVTKSLGLGIIGFADLLERLCPDLLLVLGDRFEVLAAVQAALFARIPVAHIGGGDITEGACDESIRHSITKMAHIHFATHRNSARRLAQMGEEPARIHTVGSPALDLVRTLPRMDRSTLETDLGFRFHSRNLVMTFHPETLNSASPDEQLRPLLAALERLGDDIGIVCTGSNADVGGRRLVWMMEAFAAAHPNVAVYTSLGQRRYYSLLAQVDAVVGNSSSGLYEAPSFKVPTVNIGNRQKGRPRAQSVLDCPADADAIEAAIRRAFTLDCSTVVNPYGDGYSSERIVGILRGPLDRDVLLKKRFVDREFAP
ncbi:UDP-N-acetyl-D-glucosamine 2-epimerase, UDP-hydrolysing [Gammaproteobacteria bacterium]